MEASDWVSLGVGLVAAAIAIWSVVVAQRANARSDRANRTAEEANRISTEALDTQKQALPPAWSGARATGREKVELENQSGRNILVVGIEVEPRGSEEYVHLLRKLPALVEYGDTFGLGVLRMLAGSPEKVTLRWRYEDEQVERSTDRILT